MLLSLPQVRWGSAGVPAFCSFWFLIWNNYFNFSNSLGPLFRFIYGADCLYHYFEAIFCQPFGDNATYIINLCRILIPRLHHRLLHSTGQYVRACFTLLIPCIVTQLFKYYSLHFNKYLTIFYTIKAKYLYFYTFTFFTYFFFMYYYMSYNNLCCNSNVSIHIWLTIYHVRGHTLYHNACIITANFLMTGLQVSKLIEDILCN